MIEIRGQRATDWKDLYAIRTRMPGALPYIRPDWVKEELSEPKERHWPMVAVAQTPEGARVVARTDLQLGWGRRAHMARLTLERHPDLGDAASQKLMQEAVQVAENWWNKRRLEVMCPVTDAALLALYQALGFEKEARLRRNVRMAGDWVSEVVLARLRDDALPTAPPGPPPGPAVDRGTARPRIHVRGGSADDWEAFHEIWSQPSVYWGTMQIPHPSADWNRERIQGRTSARFWPLVAEVNGQVVGNLALHRDEHNRSHVGHIGMMVHTDYQGMRVGSALMEAVIDLAENWLGLSRLQLEVYTDNARAIGLYEKYGFETEGLLRAFGYRDGQYVDTLVMGRLRDG